MADDSNGDKKEFKKILKKFIELEDACGEAAKQLKTLRGTKNDLGDQIKDYMEKNDKRPISLHNNKFVYKTTKTSKALNKESLADGLVEAVAELEDLEIDERMAQEIAQVIWDSREKVTKSTVQLKKMSSD